LISGHKPILAKKYWAPVHPSSLQSPPRSFNDQDKKFEGRQMAKE
jgi:hypothetical protein